jgi:tripartite ATP-independent transporter DctM subunit
MSIEILTILLFLSLMFLLTTGLQIVFVLGSVSIIFAYFLMGPNILGMVQSSMSKVMNMYTMLAIPLFVFMGSFLERSGVADDLYATMHKWIGSLKGGLAAGTVMICTLFAAMTGVSAAGVVTMGMIALPAMRKRNYDKNLSVGCIAAGGGLGQLIPPSTLMIVWALWAGESVGQMFIGGIIPGLILSSLYISYIFIRCGLHPEMGPPAPIEERTNWREKILSLRSVFLPLLIIIGVLGSIFAGIATPTEAAAVGSLLSMISTLIYRRFNWKNLSYALISTLRTTCMVTWIIAAGGLFASTFAAMGAQEFISTTVSGLGINRWFILIGMQVIYIVLGCLMEQGAIMMLTIPIFVPIVASLGFNTLWFGVLFIINMEMGLLTPPFGLNLFYIRGIVSEDISMMDIYRSVIPFICLQSIGLAICMIFPQTITFLPEMVFGH